MSAAAAKRRRKQKADPFHSAVLAPRFTFPSPAGACCGHSHLIHTESDGKQPCGVCGCEDWRQT